MPKLSVIVPIYNVEEYLENCIESILNQTFKDFELILVNDGSTDNSLYICYEYMSKDNRIKVIDKDNGGVSSARNRGIKIAKGEYIAFVDPDDDIESNMYEELMNRITKYNVDIVISSFKYVDLIKNNTIYQKIWSKTEKVIDKDEIKNEIFYDLLSFKEGYGIYNPVNKIYRKDILLKNNIIFDEKRHHGEDARLNLIALTKVNSIYFIDSPLYNYYIRKRESLTRIIREDLYDYILDNKNFHEHLCRLYGYEVLIKIGVQHYLNDTIQYMISISRSKFTINKKKIILKNILDDSTFKKNIKNYQCPYRYYKLLKLACMYKLSRVFIILIKLLLIKEKIDFIKSDKIVKI